MSVHQSTSLVHQSGPLVQSSDCRWPLDPGQTNSPLYAGRIWSTLSQSGSPPHTLNRVCSLFSVLIAVQPFLHLHGLFLSVGCFSPHFTSPHFLLPHKNLLHAHHSQFLLTLGHSHSVPLCVLPTRNIGACARGEY